MKQDVPNKTTKLKEFGLKDHDKVIIKTPIEEITIISMHDERLEKHLKSY